MNTTELNTLLSFFNKHLLPKLPSTSDLEKMKKKLGKLYIFFLIFLVIYIFSTNFALFKGLFTSVKKRGEKVNKKVKVVNDLKIDNKCLFKDKNGNTYIKKSDLQSAALLKEKEKKKLEKKKKKLEKKEKEKKTEKTKMLEHYISINTLFRKNIVIPNASRRVRRNFVKNEAAKIRGFKGVKDEKIKRQQLLVHKKYFEESDFKNYVKVKKEKKEEKKDKKVTSPYQGLLYNVRKNKTLAELIDAEPGRYIPDVHPKFFKTRKEYRAAKYYYINLILNNMDKAKLCLGRAFMIGYVLINESTLYTFLKKTKKISHIPTDMLKHIFEDRYEAVIAEFS